MTHHESYFIFIFRTFGAFDYNKTKDLTTHFQAENIELSKKVHDQGKWFYYIFHDENKKDGLKSTKSVDLSMLGVFFDISSEKHEEKNFETNGKGKK